MRELVSIFRQHKPQESSGKHVATRLPRAGTLLKAPAMLVLLGLIFIGCGSSSTAIRTGSSSRLLIVPVRGVEPVDLSPNFAAPRDGGARSHEGLDIIVPKNREIIACASGKVELKWNNLGGNTIWLEGDDGRSYYFAHLDRYRSGLASGNHVGASELLGYVGQTGNATTPHLHFEIHESRRSAALDPYPILRADNVLVLPLSIAEAEAERAEEKARTLKRRK